MSYAEKYKTNYIKNFEKELHDYLPPLTKRKDFDSYWQETLEENRKPAINPEIKQYYYPSPFVSVYSLSYNGFDATRINGWYMIPQFVNKEKYPCLVHFHGFGGNRGMPSDFMHWIMMGIAVISIDCRDQCGNTGNAASYSCGSTQSVICKGILSKYEYYFRALYMDCIRALDFACSRNEIDVKKLIIEGGSQGGALGMAVSALDDRPFIAMVDVPSNSNLEKRIEYKTGAFATIAEYLSVFPENVDKVFDTLSYFDTMNMADKIRCKVLASVGLKDDICPPRFYFATYNRITSEKDIILYPFNGHEGGGNKHTEIKLQFLKTHL